MTRVLALSARDQGEGYPRAAALVAAARHAGCDVREVDVEVPGAGREKQRIARSPWLWPSFAWKLRRARRRALATLRQEIVRFAPDLVLVLYPGHALVHWARAAFRGPVVLDLFLTAHDTLVLDRGAFAEGSWIARFLARLDTRACSAADLVLLDTGVHAARVAELTGLPRERFDMVPVSDVAAPTAPTPYVGQRPGEKLEVLFFGTGVPLHGLRVLLDAVERVPGVRLTLVGGSAAERVRATALPPGRVTLLEPFVGRQRLDALLRATHLVAGVFGTGRKADLVIPLKVMHALSHGRPVITGESRAVGELLTPEVDVMTVPRGDSAALAARLAALLDAPGELRALATRARSRFESTFSVAATAERLATCLRERLDMEVREPGLLRTHQPEPVPVP